MACDFIVYIGRNRLSCYYSQNKERYKCYKYEDNEYIPLYFYSEGHQFSIGNSAKLNYQHRIHNSFCDYFSIIKKTDSTFHFFNEEIGIKNLLVKGIEIILSQFAKEILFKSDSIADLRNHFNLKLVFSSDIQQNEINFVGELFKGLGYNELILIYYNYLLLNHLDSSRKIGSFKGYILLDGIDENLYIEYFDYLSSKSPKFNKIGKELANDPKDKIIAEMLFDDAVLKTGAPFKADQRKEEIANLIPIAKKCGKSPKNQFYQKVTLSDGSTANVKIRMSKVNEILTFKANNTKDFDAVQEIEQKTKISNPDLKFIARKSISSTGFLDKLRSQYNNVYHSLEEENDVFDLFISNSDIIDIGNFLNITIKKNVCDVCGMPKCKCSNSVSKTTPVNKKKPLPPPSSPPLMSPPPPKSEVKVKNTKKQTNIPAASKIPPPPPPPPPPPRKVVAGKSGGQVKSKSKKPPPPPPPPPPSKVVAGKSGGQAKSKGKKKPPISKK